MLIFLTTLLATLWSIFRSRASLGLENLALRHQIGVLHRSAGKRPKLTAGDRLLWICLSRLWRDWRSALAIVKPETVVAWHRAAFRLFWTWKVRCGKPGRPVISSEVRDLIRKMCRENPGWGAPRIHGELRKLGIDIGQSSVSKYMVRCRKPPSQTWRTFLENHAKQLVSIDFFAVPTIRFQVLYVFLVLAHDRRRILHFNVTAHPTSEWTARRKCSQKLVFASRSRQRVRAGIQRDGEMHGHSRSPDGAPKSLAERLSRATDRIDSTRVLGSRHRFE